MIFFAFLFNCAILLEYAGMELAGPTIRTREMDFSPPSKEPTLYRKNAEVNQQKGHLQSVFQILNEAKTHQTHDLLKRKFSSEFDLLLGFRIKKIEETLRTHALQIKSDSFFDEWGPLLHDGAQTWVGLDFQILQSTYHDLYQIFEHIKPRKNETIIDLGAGYGRLGLFLHHFYPETHFLGLELVSERVDEAKRIYHDYQLKNKEMIVSDLSHLTDLPEGDFYFIYDFGSDEHIKKILNLFKSTPGKTLIVKGQICRKLIERDPYFSEGFKIKKCDDVYVYLT